VLDYESVHVGIDIGASKTIVLISQKDIISGELLILGVGEFSNTTGIKRGKIVDLNNTILSIQRACEEAQLMSGVEFDWANINIPGEVESLNSHGIVTIARKDREVKMKDVERVIEQAQMINIKSDKTMLHLFPQYFQLDEQSHIKDPIGMTGLRLQGAIHMILVPSSNVMNAVKCFLRANVKAKEGLFNAYAASNAVLSNEDKEIGSLLLDIGAGSIDIIGFQDGAPYISGVVMLGGDSITRDLSIGLKIPEALAEEIKKKNGVAFLDLVDPLEEIEIPSYKGKEVKRVNLEKIASIIEPRVQEMFYLVNKFLETKNISINNFSCVILTGGCANLKGIIEVAEEVFNVPVRLGIVNHLGGLFEKVNAPEYATVIGLCMGEVQELQFNIKNRNFNKEKNSSNLLGRMKGFFKDMLG
jgi:cell division protein FtsA